MSAAFFFSLVRYVLCGITIKQHSSFNDWNKMQVDAAAATAQRIYAERMRVEFCLFMLFGV